MRIIFILTIFLSIYLSLESKAAPLTLKLQDFEYDKCTLFPEGPSDNPNLWEHCCFEHDLRYWFGGTREDKKYSDIQLRECVREVAGDFWANIIYTGVSVGNLSPIKFKYVWSWGWEPKRKKIPLSTDETEYIITKLKELGLDPEFEQKFVNKYLLKN